MRARLGEQFGALQPLDFIAHARRLMAALTAAFATGQLAGPLVANALQALGLGLDAALWLGTAGLLASSLLLVRPTPHPLPETETRS